MRRGGCARSTAGRRSLGNLTREGGDAVRSLLFVAIASVLVTACTNDPYPAAPTGKKVLYSSFTEAPKTLDPAVAYTTAEHVITGNVYDTLLEYHYLKRPYQLIPGLAEAVPVPETLGDGRQVYRFKLRPGVFFHADPCFQLSTSGAATREVRPADFAFALQRIADPKVNSPVVASFSAIAGFDEFAHRLGELRRDAAFAALPVHEQYRRAGGISGITARGERELELTLQVPNAQILYWFAMPFTTPVAWEAVAYYNGRSHPNFADHAVGTGPFRLALYDKHFRFVLERNEGWYGNAPENSAAPGVTFPDSIDPKDVAERRIDPAYMGRRMPFVDRVMFSRERENIPRFNKFLQGYYDDGGIIKESFDAVVQGDRLSPEMAAKGMRLDKTVEPSIRYIGFNMDDSLVGSPGGERARKLRQAMSAATDADRFLELFLNGRGVKAQSLLPPGLFGYDAQYLNPFRRHDVALARRLLREAGFPDGVDALTGKLLKLTFDTAATSAAASLEFEFLATAWRDLGIDVEVAGTTYNQFQDKIRRGAYQIFIWGWLADFPDPENFLFLLTCKQARSKSGGPNTANFCDAEFDRLYAEMRARPDDDARRGLIARMIGILERERPWIELYYEEDYTLSHAWLINAKPMGISYPAYKYRDVDVSLRARLRKEWNAPVRWPAYVLIIAVLGLALPAVSTYYRERL